MAKISVFISLLINMIEITCFIIFFNELYRHKKRHRRLSRTYTPQIARRHAGQAGISIALELFKHLSGNILAPKAIYAEVN